MTKLKLISSNPMEKLFSISQEIGEKYSTENGFAFTSVATQFGKGAISATSVSKEISVLIFDTIFHEDLEICIVGDSKNNIDFVFCLEGHIYHKFGSKSSFEPINFRQNTIINRKSTSKTLLKIPANVRLKMSLISYQPTIHVDDLSEFNQLRLNAFKVLSEIYANDNHMYSGRICFRTSSFVSDIMKFNVKSPANILFKEAAILNTVASQIDRHQTDTSSHHANAPIRLYEIDTILSLETFIEDNLTESLTLDRLEQISGLSPSKLQSGFKYLYNKTVSVYVTEKRLEKAAKLIYETDLNVSELVYSVGFSSRSYFSKIFKNHFGILPSKCMSNPELLKVIHS